MVIIVCTHSHVAGTVGTALVRRCPSEMGSVVCVCVCIGERSVC